jgi:hypothetical protein
MEHLSCFAAGWLALGSRHQTDQGRARRHMKLAEDIAETYAEKTVFSPAFYTENDAFAKTGSGQT